MLVVVFNDALVRYIAEVLPALGVAGRRAAHLRELGGAHAPGALPAPAESLRREHAERRHAAEEAPRDARGRRGARRGARQARPGRARSGCSRTTATRARARSRRSPPARRDPSPIAATRSPRFVTSEAGKALSTNARVALERIAGRGLATSRDVPRRLGRALHRPRRARRILDEHAPGAFSRGRARTRARLVRGALESAVVAELDTEHEAGRPRRRLRRRRR